MNGLTFASLGERSRWPGWSSWLPFVLALLLVGCGPSAKSSSSDKTTGELGNQLKVELVSIPPFSGDKVRLLLKVTNVSKRDIVRAKAAVTVLDAAGKPLGTKSTYLVHGQKGGLAAGASVEEDAIIDVSDKSKAVGMSFVVEDIRFKN